jgi:F-type H+-transporting ATPase subunit epsilon
VASIHLKILTPKGSFFDGDVEFINFSNSIGKIEILPGHIAYMSEMEPSVFEIKQGGKLRKAAVTGGIADFRSGEAYVLADTAEWPGEIDAERAGKAYERARTRIRSRDKDIDSDRAERALLRASVRMKLARLKEGSDSSL